MARHLNWLNFGSLGANANKTRQTSAHCNWRVSIKVRARHRSGSESVSSAAWIQYNKKNLNYKNPKIALSFQLNF